VVLEPLKRLRIPWTFYHTNSKFEIEDDINPKEGEYIIANNYFGLKDVYITQLAEKYGNHLIVDCAQAFFAKPIPSIKSFYSARKYVGVADGGIAYMGNDNGKEIHITEKECTVDHDSHLIKRKEFGAEAGFADYQANEIKLDYQPIRWMSNTTKRILEHINYEKVINKRRTNFMFLHKSLRDKNFLDLPDFDSFVCPMVYPFVTRNDRDLRKELIENKIFVAKYWPNVNQISNYETEFQMATRVIPIPCDQRYGRLEMQKILNIIIPK
jgi:dTDP-4-amino-4,6-dideoxygalactose transaminase